MHAHVITAATNFFSNLLWGRRPREAEQPQKDGSAFARFIAVVSIHVLADVFAEAHDPLIGARLAVACKAASRRLARLTPYEAEILWPRVYAECFPRVTRLMPCIERQIERGELTRGQASGRQLVVIVQWLRNMVLRLEYADHTHKMHPFFYAQTSLDLRIASSWFQHSISRRLSAMSNVKTAAPRVFLHIAGRVFEENDLLDLSDLYIGVGKSRHTTRVFDKFPCDIMRLRVVCETHSLFSPRVTGPRFNFFASVEGTFEITGINNESLVQLDEFLGGGE